MKRIICLAIILLISCNDASAQDLKKDLAAYWSFDDSTARDQSGNGYHGTIKNSPKPVEGVHGKGTAFRFQGKGYYIMNYESDTQIGDHILLECPRNFGHIVKIISAFRRLPVTCNQ